MADETEGYVRSIARGINVIEALGSSPGRHTMSEIAQLTELTRATVRRVLMTLVSLNYVSHDGKYYQLKPRALRLGLSYLNGLPFWPHAQFALEDLRNELGESCSIAVLDEAETVYIARLPARRLITANLGVGSCLPAHLVSLGRVLLAEANHDEQSHCLGMIDFSKVTPKSVGSDSELREILKVVRDTGYAWVDGELDPSVCGIAVPIRNLLGQVVASINVSLISGAYNEEEARNRFLVPLKRTAQEIRSRMG